MHTCASVVSTTSDQVPVKKHGVLVLYRTKIIGTFEGSDRIMWNGRSGCGSCCFYQPHFPVSKCGWCPGDRKNNTNGSATTTATSPFSSTSSPRHHHPPPNLNLNVDTILQFHISPCPVRSHPRGPLPLTVEGLLVPGNIQNSMKSCDDKKLGPSPIGGFRGP